MAYKTYWDHTEEERAELSSDNIEELIKYELMQQGVLKPSPPVYETEAPPKLSSTNYYKVVLKFQSWGRDEIPVLFKNPVDARTFLEMEWDFLDYEHSEHCARSRTEQEIVSVELPSYDEVVAHQAAIKTARKATERNEQKRRDYEKQLEEVARASSGVWSDWHRCLAQRDHLERIRQVYQEYFEMAGDSQVALRFLLKVKDFEVEDITKALPEYAELVYDMSGKRPDSVPEEVETETSDNITF